ncbi:MAG: protein-L-isoaspartate(D-aspartate) O-methyltransferase [Planctomycetota bacterium]|jgi:protein-L-isoaspartate(D-aspartate) O-methyltransferase
MSERIIRMLIAAAALAVAGAAVWTMVLRGPAGTGPGGRLTGLQETPPDQAPTPPETTVPYRRATPPAAAALVDERHRLVDEALARSGFGRSAIRDPDVLAAMRTVPRHAFVPATYRDRAYQDSPLPIGEGQTISQPYIVALMTELLRLEPTSRVLEIGTGSGYQAAVLAHLTPHVYSIEIIAPLAKRADQVLAAQGYDEIERRQGDGYHGWAEHAPYDAIIVTCAAGHLPPALWDQLRPGGRIIIPMGGPYEIQRLVLITKQPDGSRRSETVTAVRFVPMTRAGEP